MTLMCPELHGSHLVHRSFRNCVLTLARLPLQLPAVVSIIYLFAAAGLTSLCFTSIHRCICGWMIRQVSMSLVVELLVVVHLYPLVTPSWYVGMGFHHDRGVSASGSALH